MVFWNRIEDDSAEQSSASCALVRDAVSDVGQNNFSWKPIN